MKKTVLVFAAMFALTTAMAQEDCSKKCDKAKIEKKCDGKKMDCCEKKEGCDKKMDCCGKKKEGCDKKMEGQKPCRTAMMVEQLGLNEDQAEKVKALNEKYADALEAPHHGKCPLPQMKQKKELKVDGVTGATEQKVRTEHPMREASPEMKQKMEERRSQMKAYDEELKGILTEEQFKAYQENMGPRHMQKGMRREMMKKQ